MTLKLLAAAGVVGALGLSVSALWVWWRHRGDVSDRWLRDLARAEGRRGWEGARWRFPREIAEQERRARVERIASARARQWQQGRRA